jgi:hypothetical protein
MDIYVRAEAYLRETEGMPRLNGRREVVLKAALRKMRKFYVELYRAYSQGAT